MGHLARLAARKARMGQGRQLIRAQTISAPIKGWNDRDALLGMDPGFAPLLDNWFPETSHLSLRGGYTAHATGIGAGAVETVFSYSAGDNVTLLAAGDGGIYDATAASTAPLLQSGYTSDRWQGVNHYGVAILVNGADAAQSYDGSSIGSAGFTGSGLDSANLIAVHSFKERLFLAENETAIIWYGGVKQITGALSKFDLGAVHPAGGTVTAIGSFTLDGGAGPDDLIAFLFSGGDVLIYAGTDPGDSDLWAIVGRYKVGPPIGRRPMVQIGADLIAITADGYIPMRSFLQTGRGQRRLAISDNISRAVNRAVATYRGNFGWDATLYPAGNMLIVNVPTVEGAQAVQHVMNTLTGAWCRFRGQPAMAFCVHSEGLYFGGPGGVVYRADSGKSDAGANIEADAITAWIFFGGSSVNKHFTLFRTFMASDSDFTLTAGLGVDFQDEIQVAALTSAVSALGAEWDVAEWGEAEWGGGLVNRNYWQHAGDVGVVAAVRVKTQSMANEIYWFGTGVAWKQGGLL